ncbi:hypothetical protein FQZ97_530620 [compost metagenome]
MLQRRDELAGFEQALVRARIEPRIAALHDLHVELVQVQVRLVDRRDLQFAVRARLHGLGDVDDLVVVEIQAGHGVAALGLDGLLFDAAGLAVGIEGHHAVALGVMHVVREHGRTALLRISVRQQMGKVMPIEDVVPQHQRARRVPHELVADDECLRQAIGTRLHRVLQVDAPLAAVTQQLLEARRVLRRADDEDVAHAAEHQGAQRVIDHGLVVHRQQLLAHGERGRVQAGAGATGEDDAFALRHGGLLL